MHNRNSLIQTTSILLCFLLAMVIGCSNLENKDSQKIHLFKEDINSLIKSGKVVKLDEKGTKYIFSYDNVQNTSDINKIAESNVGKEKEHVAELNKLANERSSLKNLEKKLNKKTTALSLREEKLEEEITALSLREEKLKEEKIKLEILEKKIIEQKAAIDAAEAKRLIDNQSLQKEENGS